MSTPVEPHGRAVLPPLTAETAAAVLAPPRLPSVAVARVALARGAGAGAIPVLLAAPAGAGRLLIARALHALAGRQGPFLAATGRRPPLHTLPPDATLYLEVGNLAPEAALALETVLDDGLAWVLAGIAPDATPPVALGVRLGAVVLEVPPLAERGAELPALAGEILDRLARRTGMPSPDLSPAALLDLAAHPWPGDLHELEAVLGRALLVARGQTIAAEHLALAAEPAAAAPAPTAPAPPARDAELEFLLAELAHELRNPMVTIKTFARHLPALLEDAALRARFDTLASEAIDRMDSLLENVLAFARLGAPHPEAVEVAPLLERVLGEVEGELNGRTVRLEQSAPGARCAADPAQLAYALRNLFAGVVREVPPREALTLEATANGVVTLRFAAGAEAADRLRRLAAPGENVSLADPSLLPLAFRLARAVLERNGGALSVVPEAGDATSVVIRLPTAPAEEAS